MKRRTLLAGSTSLPTLSGADDGARARALVRAAEAGDLAALRSLLDTGTPVEIRDARRRTALLEAIFLGNDGAAHTESKA